MRSPHAARVWLCLFDDAGAETRLPMDRLDDAIHALFVPGLRPGQRYGYRAEGEWAPERCRWFDPDKLLVDPYAVELDHRFIQNRDLALPAGSGVDTAPIVPRAIVPDPLPPVPPHAPRFTPGGLIYELNVRGFTALHPDVPEAERGTIGALAHPAVIAHLTRLGVDAVELMPIVAWIDERHLPPFGLRNAWGYNPVALMALDPGLAPGGVAELRRTVEALHAAGIGMILDLVFNHTGESDVFGGVLSLRGLDDDVYARAPDGRLINDTGCGNTLACWRPEVRALILNSLRLFVGQAGVDGFRFDLAPILAHTPDGFDPAAALFAEIAADPLLHDRVMIAEPWDIGPGGYQLGRFPPTWLEWNDRFRDDVRRFWRGDDGLAGPLATRITGSSDIFGGEARSRSVNFLAAHDGFTLADLVAHEQRHNEANGEQNRDGHGENFSWNNGVEGPTDDPDIRARRQTDVRALLATLFASRGTIMLTAGDAFGRSQGGNNNAYAQDNETTWIDWSARNEALEAFVAELSTARRATLAEDADAFLDPATTRWLTLDGAPMTDADWWGSDGFELVTTAGGRALSIRVDRRAGSRGVVLARTPKN